MNTDTVREVEELERATEEIRARAPGYTGRAIIIDDEIIVTMGSMPHPECVELLWWLSDGGDAVDSVVGPADEINEDEYVNEQVKAAMMAALLQ